MRFPGPLPPRSAALDAGIGAASVAASLVLARHAGSYQPGTRPLDVPGCTLAVLAGAAVTARRLAPLPVLGIVAGALLVFTVRNNPGGPLLVPVMVAVYTAGTAVERPAALALGAAVTVIVGARTWLATTAGRVSVFTWAAPGWVLASLAWGAAVRSRRQLLESSRLRAELAEQTREAEAAIAVEVTNDSERAASGTAGQDGAGGRGVTGMRERVTALGGVLQAGAADGGFRVTATLPVPGGEP